MAGTTQTGRGAGSATGWWGWLSGAKPAQAEASDTRTEPARTDPGRTDPARTDPVETASRAAPAPRPRDTEPVAAARDVLILTQPRAEGPAPTKTETAGPETPVPATPVPEAPAPESAIPESASPGNSAADVPKPEATKPRSPESAAPEPATGTPAPAPGTTGGTTGGGSGKPPPKGPPSGGGAGKDRPPRRGGVRAGAILGGVVAAGLGAAAILYLFPRGWQPVDASAELVALHRRIAELESRPMMPPVLADNGDLAAVMPDLSALEARLDALEATRTPADQTDMPDLEPLLARLSALESALAGLDPEGSTLDLAPLAARVDALEGSAAAGLSLDPAATEARIAALEARDATDLSPELAAALERIAALEAVEVPDPEAIGSRIAALGSQLPGWIEAAVDAAFAETRAELEAERARLAEARIRSELLSAIGTLGLAAETGAAAPEALARIAELPDLPAALDGFRQGLPTLPALQADFPAAARAALAAAPPAAGTGVADRVMGFLRAQTGARSLAPRAGDDPDAILSRAEAAVRRGALAAALDELAGLPDQARAPLADWLDRARARLDAIDALNELSARLGAD